MSELQDEGRALLDQLRSVNLTLSIEKRRLQALFEQRAERDANERDDVQSTIDRLRPMVSADMATEVDEVEYLVALHRRSQLDQLRFEMRESIAQLNLPVETLILQESVELDGTQTVVDV